MVLQDSLHGKGKINFKALRQYLDKQWFIKSGNVGGGGENKQRLIKIT